MSFVSDLKILYHLALAPIKGRDHQERLDSFYAGQARGYDSFRAHLLKGRQELFEQIDVPQGGVWVEMGGGTAANLEYLGERLERLKAVHVVDLSSSLLEVARERIAANGWSNVRTRQEDVTQFELPAGADVVTFSYSLTMIPDWFAALENALKILKPGGTLAVVDFHVSRKYPAEGRRRHSWLTRTFWPAWLGLDNVFPSPDHLPYLERHLQTRHISEHRARMRYFPLFSVPYYLFIGTPRNDKSTR
jgi:S-adenosylmethionine-diacylgycerolhomoserine-N-methlytransferase